MPCKPCRGRPGVWVRPFDLSPSSARMKSKIRVLTGLAVAAASLSAQAQTIAIQAVQDASGVTISYSGSVDLSGYFPISYFPNINSTQVRTSSGVFSDLSLGASGDTSDTYQFSGGFNAPLWSPAPNAAINGTSKTGDVLRYRTEVTDASPPPGGGTDYFPYAFLSVPSGYSSGSALSGSATFPGQTLGSLGLAAGQTLTYNYPANTFTINASVSAVPEPSEWTALGAGMCGVVALVRRMRQQSKA